MVATDSLVKQGLLAGGLPNSLVDELTEAYSEAKRNHWLGGHRLAEVEAGRFCEAAYRLLEHITSQTHTPLGTPLDTDKIARALAVLPRGSFSDSVRLHIPRTLRVVFDVRNNRDAAHLSDGIDPNVQDSSLVVACLNWVMAELVRLYHNISAAEASEIVNNLVRRIVPAIQEFDGIPRILKDLPASDSCLLILYRHGSDPMTRDSLRDAVEPSMRANLNRTLRRLYERRQIHLKNDLVWITWEGERFVEDEGLANGLLT